MATYLPICCFEPVVIEKEPDIDDKLDSLLQRIEDLENRPIPVPIIQKTVVKEITMWGINFNIDSDVIKPGFYPTLDYVVDLMQKNPTYELTIKGHTDNTAGYEYNMALSKRRAEAVKRYMVERDVNADRIATEGYGYTEPIDTNDTAYGRSRNRRVDFLIVVEDTTMESLPGPGDINAR